MLNAVIVDSEYGSVSLEKQIYLVEKYQENGINLRLAHYETPEEIVANCQGVDAILGTGNPPITKEVLRGIPSLKVVQRFGIGVNSVDLDAATEAGVLVLFMPGFCVDELAFHATALIMDLLRNVSYYDRGIRGGKWRKAKGPVPRNPQDLTLGLYGFGGSAKPLYNIFRKGFNSRVIAHDPYINEKTKAEYEVEFVSFEALLRESDIISIHAPLTPETHHIFNAEAFKQMKADSMIINISRGGLINQKDLAKALDSGEIGFAGLDVFEEEPLPAKDALVASDRAVLTCHSAFYGVQAQQNQIDLAIQLVDSVLNDGSIDPKYLANKVVKTRVDALSVLGKAV